MNPYLLRLGRGPAAALMRLPQAKQFLTRMQFWTDVVWDNSEAGAATKRNALELRRLLRPWTDANLKLERVGRRGDGGYVMDTSWRECDSALSIGVGTEMTWDLALADSGLRVWQFDHTIQAPPSTHPKIAWQPLGLGNDGEGSSTRKRSLGTLTRMSVGSLSRMSILKMDVEGAEWSALPNQDLRPFEQVLIELHGLERQVLPWNWAQTKAALETLLNEHSVIHLHANNCCGLAIASGVILPRVLEVTLIRRQRLTDAEPLRRSNPNVLDEANVEGRPELWFPEFWDNVG